MKCPVRKNIISQKRRNAIQEKTSYANKAKANNTPLPSKLHQRHPFPLPQPPIPPPPAMPDAIKEIEIEMKKRLKINAIIRIAFQVDHDNPGSFSVIYNTLAEENDLPTLNLDKFVAPAQTTMKNDPPTISMQNCLTLVKQPKVNNPSPSSMMINQSPVSVKKAVNTDASIIKSPSSTPPVQVVEDVAPPSSNDSSISDCEAINTSAATSSDEVVIVENQMSRKLKYYRCQSAKENVEKESDHKMSQKLELYKLSSARTGTSSTLISAIKNRKALIIINGVNTIDPIVIENLVQNNMTKSFTELDKNELDKLSIQYNVPNR